MRFLIRACIIKTSEPLFELFLRKAFFLVVDVVVCKVELYWLQMGVINMCKKLYKNTILYIKTMLT